MQTPLNKRVIGRHVGQKRKKGAHKVPAHTERLATNSACGPLAMQMICHSRLPGFPACPVVQVAQLPAWLTGCRPGHLLGGRATKIKTKQRFPIKATTRSLWLRLEFWPWIVLNAFAWRHRNSRVRNYATNAWAKSQVCLCVCLPQPLPTHLFLPWLGQLYNVI